MKYGILRTHMGRERRDFLFTKKRKNGIDSLIHYLICLLGFF